MIFKIIRAVLTPVVLGINFITTPRKPNYSAEVQNQLDSETSNMALYQFKACPFCIKTRRAIRRLGLNIEIRDAQKNLEHRARLTEEGGECKVPCLVISENGETRWMYESSDIVSYLEQRFTQSKAA